MDSLRSTHARLAALCRYRTPDDPEVVATRAELERRTAQVRAARSRVGSLPRSVCVQILAPAEGALS